MYTHLYALNEQNLRHFVGEVRDITEGRKSRAWPFLYDRIAAFRPRPRLGISGGPERPYTEVSYHTSRARGWTDFDRDRAPQWGDPRLEWILRMMALECSEHVLRGRDARFNAVFCIWLDEQKVIRSPEEREAYDRWRQRVFYSREPVPADLWFLETDSHRAYLSPDVVSEFAQMERDVGLLRSVAARLEGAQYGDLVASELLRIRQFFELVDVEKGAIYYAEEAT